MKACYYSFDSFESKAITEEFFCTEFKKLPEDFLKEYLNFQVSRILNDRIRLEAANILGVERLNSYTLALNQDWVNTLKSIGDYIESNFSTKGIERSKYELENWDFDIKPKYFDYVFERFREQWKEVY